MNSHTVVKSQVRMRRLRLLFALAVLIALYIGGMAAPASTARHSVTFSTLPPGPTARQQVVLAVTATVPVLPDLVVSALQITLERGGACDYTSTTLGLRVWIENAGAATTASFVVEANGDRQTVAGGLGAGQTTSLFFDSYVYPGDNTVVVDVTSVVAEADETNNRRTEPVPIPTLPRPCTATPTETTGVTATATATATETSGVTATPTTTATDTGACNGAPPQPSPEPCVRTEVWLPLIRFSVHDAMIH